MSDRHGYNITDQYAAYFLTFTIVDWIDLFTRRECRDILIYSMKYCQKNKGLIILAYVIMSNHIHVVWRADEKSDGLSAIVRDFKKFTSKALIKWLSDNPEESRRKWLDVLFKSHGKNNPNNTKYQVWQQYSRPMIILHPKFSIQKIEYIHNNPVVAGIVDHPADYIYSSARHYYGRDDGILDVEILDFGAQEGYVFT